MNDDIDIDDSPNEEVKRLMVEQDIEQDTAEKAQELIDEGLDEEEAIELTDEIF